MLKKMDSMKQTDFLKILLLYFTLASSLFGFDSIEILNKNIIFFFLLNFKKSKWSNALLFALFHFP